MLSITSQFTDKLKKDLTAALNPMDPVTRKIVWAGVNGFANAIPAGLTIGYSYVGYPDEAQEPRIVNTSLAVALVFGLIGAISSASAEWNLDRNHRRMKLFKVLRITVDSIVNSLSTWLYTNVAINTIYSINCRALGGQITYNYDSGAPNCNASSDVYTETFLMGGILGAPEFFRTLLQEIYEDAEEVDQDELNWLQKFARKSQPVISAIDWLFEPIINATTYQMSAAWYRWDLTTALRQGIIMLAMVPLAAISTIIKKLTKIYSPEEKAKFVAGIVDNINLFLGSIAGLIAMALYIIDYKTSITSPDAFYISLALTAAIGILAPLWLNQHWQKSSSAPMQIQGDSTSYEILPDFKPLGPSYDSDDENPTAIESKFSNFGISKTKAYQIIDNHFLKVEVHGLLKESYKSSHDQNPDQISNENIKAHLVAMFELDEIKIDANVIAVLTQLQTQYPAEFSRENSVNQEMRTIGINPGSNRYGTFGQSNASGRMEDPNLSESSNYRPCVIL